jgi:hypothetical protein
VFYVDLFQDKKGTMLQYSAMDRAKNDFRQLNLHPGEEDADIKCMLNTIRLESFSRHFVDPFGVLIYDWHHSEVLDEAEWEKGVFRTVKWCPNTKHSPTPGESTITSSIEINGRKVHVTANLLSALRRFRKKTRDRILLIDALCIDQSNLVERAEQVRHIVSIYQRARRVLIWLGETNTDSDLAMDLLEEIGGNKKQVSGFTWLPMDWLGLHFDQFDGLGEPVNDKMKALAQYVMELGLIGPEIIDQAGWTALKALLTQRRWWQRAWVVQEVSNAQSAKLVCGSRAIRRETLEHSRVNAKFHQSRTFRNLFDQGPGPLIDQRIATRNPYRALFFESENKEMLRLLLTFSQYGCSDPRDKIYAFTNVG